MSKSLEELILRAENQAAASAAVRRAVEQADAAGYPPADQTDSGDMSWLEKDPAKRVELHRAAVKAKKQQDEVHRQRHRLICQLMDGPQGEWIRQKAHEQIDKWERNQLCHPRYWDMWRKWLALPSSFHEKTILREDDIGVSMRQNSPFSHSFSLVEPALSQAGQDQP